MTISKECSEATSECNASSETRSRSKGTLDTQGMDDKATTAFDLETLRIRKIFTLIFIHDKDSDQLLLGKKLRGPLLGQWNGFGGKVERGLDRSIAQSAARELQEEAFIRAPLFPIGFIQWVVTPNKVSQDTDDETYRDVMVVYKAHAIESFSHDQAPHSPLSSDPCISSLPAASAVHHSQPSPPDQPGRALPTEFMPSDEMAPAWWSIDYLPWESMRINHKVWYPFLLADRPFSGVYWYETRSSFPGDEGLVGKQLTMKQLTTKQPLRKENAQRETSKEIWVEDLGKRRFQFGRRRICSSQDHIQDQLEENQQLLADFALRLGLANACYKGGVADTLQGREGQHSTDELGSEPVPSDSIDEGWLDGAIAKAEEDWVLRPSLRR